MHRVDAWTSEAVIPSWLMLPLAIAAVLAVFSTTKAGRRWVARLGIPLRIGRAAVDRETRDYLLAACRGDRREMTRRVEAERARLPDLDEAALYRRAVRRVMQERGGPRDLDEPV